MFIYLPSLSVVDQDIHSYSCYESEERLTVSIIQYVAHTLRVPDSGNP